MVRIVTLGLAALFLLPGARAQDKKDDKYVLKVDGKLTNDDPKDKLFRGPSQTHKVKLGAGYYIIDLKSDDFDAYLRLLDAAGKQVAEDDDSGGGPRGLNARLGYKVEKDGMFQVVATAFDKKPGAYQLTVQKATEEEVAKIDPFYELIGKPAPELQGVFSTNGETKKLSDLKGKVVVLDFWAVWCGPCIQTFPHLISMCSDHKKEGLEILGVTTYFEVLGFDKDKG